MSDTMERFAKALPAPLGSRLRRDVVLAEQTTYRVGGPARLWLEPESEAQLVEALAVAAQTETPVALLGNGSNVIAPDEGIDGLVLKLGARFAEIRVLDDSTLYAQAGALLQQLSERALQLGRAGLEWMVDIPGSVGGATLMNAGNNEGEMRRVLRRVHVIDAGGDLRVIDVEDCALGYRHSRFKQSGEIIVAAELALGKADDPSRIRERMHQQKVTRRRKFPMEYGNAGSVFKRPPGHYAGRLIESCGIKGLRVGRAQVSPKHAGFIVNLGGARAADILALIAAVQERVRAQTGVQLEPEQLLLQAGPWPKSSEPLVR